MNSMVESQPAMNQFTSSSQNSFSCGRRSLSDVNENFTGPHISKPPQVRLEHQKQLFDGFEKVDVDTSVDFGLKSSAAGDYDYTAIKIESDNDEIQVSKAKKKKKKRKTAGNGGGGETPMETQNTEEGNTETKKKLSRQARWKKKQEQTNQSQKNEQLSERGIQEAGEAKPAVVAIPEPQKRPKRRIKDIKAAKENQRFQAINLQGIEENKRREKALKEAKKEPWSMPKWVEEEERERRKKRAQKGKKKKDEQNQRRELNNDTSDKEDQEQVIEQKILTEEKAEESEADEIDDPDEWIPTTRKEKKEKEKRQKEEVVKTVEEEVQIEEEFNVEAWPELTASVDTTETHSPVPPSSSSNQSVSINLEPSPEPIKEITESKETRLSYVTDNALGLSFLVLEDSETESETVEYYQQDNGVVELTFTVEEETKPEDIFNSTKFTVTSLADIEGDQHVIDFDQDYIRMINYHITEFEKSTKSAIRYCRPAA